MRTALLTLLAVGTATPGVPMPEWPALPTRASIVVLVSQDAEPFHQALAGLRAQLGRQAELTVVNLYDEPSQAIVRVRASTVNRPAVIVALGSAATRAALALGGTVPVVASMILEPGELAGADNATGVYLQFPVGVELQWLARLMPEARRIGVVYHSQTAAGRVAEATRLAPALGLTVRAFQVASPEQIPDALAALAGQTDVLWGQIDPVVYNAETAKSILLFSFRAMIPLMGPAPTWVRAGGLLALERDYRDIGMQSAEMVERILAGASAGSIPPAGPRTVRYVLNTRTAEQVRFVPTGAMLRGAGEIFR